MEQMTHIDFGHAAAACDTQRRSRGSVIKRRVSCDCNSDTTPRREVGSPVKDGVQLREL